MVIKSPVEKILEEIHASLKGNFEGALPDYIPELAKADPAHFGITLADAGLTPGGMAFIDGSKRSASVLADSPVVCHALTRSDFEPIGSEHPGFKVKLLRNLLRVFSANLRKADREIAILAQ